VDISAARRRSVLVVGGGIGGLTTAVALRRLGYDVEVAEIAADWSVAGWGLSLTGSALRALAVLGLEQRCIDLGYGLDAIAVCDGDGNELAAMRLPSLIGAGRPAQLGIGRPMLARVLREAAEESGAVLRNSLTLSSVRETGNGVTAELSDGSTRSVDLVVAADGIGSRTRRLLGIADVPAYSGQVGWRALVPRPGWADRLFTFGGPAGNGGVIPLSREGAYCFLIENTGSAGRVPDESLAEAMRGLLAPFGGRVAAVRDVITDPATVVRRPIQTVMVNGPWHVGRVLLIGDAVHSPTPQLGSGAALAIEDAVVLAEELAADTDTEAALTAFERRRRDRVRMVVETSAAIGRAQLEGRHDDARELSGKGQAAMAAPV
jgi:2-polyprenyl-6-methoxyphenol hydroxylase-like FAD-dependent oxidoreductase